MVEVGLAFGRETRTRRILGVFTILEVYLVPKNKLFWVGKHTNIIMKPTKSPTQGQPNPKKKQVKSGIWATVPHSIIFFSWVGIGFK